MTKGYFAFHARMLRNTGKYTKMGGGEVESERDDEPHSSININMKLDLKI
jgi:hypothetical protein